jgi:hypothetical protein
VNFALLEDKVLELESKGLSFIGNYQFQMTLLRTFDLGELTEAQCAAQGKGRC